MSERRIRLTINYDHQEDGANGDFLPEPEDFYTENPITPGGGDPMPYAEYLKTYGDPDRYTGYFVTLEELCTCCGHWHEVATKSGYAISFYDEDDPGERTLTPEEADKVDGLEDYADELDADRIGGDAS